MLEVMPWHDMPRVQVDVPVDEEAKAKAMMTRMRKDQKILL